MQADRATFSPSRDPRLLTLYPLAFGGICVLLVKAAVMDKGVAELQRFSVTTLSLVVEALPFLLIGSVLSALVHVYVSEKTLLRLLPRNRFLAVLAASALGLILPVCDCATVPIVKRLLGKGVPLHVAVTFMLAVPMINPLVIFSTWFAFVQRPVMLLYRLVFGALTAIVIGLLLSVLDRKDEVMPGVRSEPGAADAHSHHDGQGLVQRVREIAEHAGSDFFDIGRYFLAGVLLSSFIQTVLPVQSLAAVGHSPLLAVPLMIAAAYLLSLCSQADAFIAQSFLLPFSTGSIVAFLVFGPMIDLKNTLMLVPVLRKRLILLLIGMVAGCCLVIGYWIDLRAVAS